MILATPEGLIDFVPAANADMRGQDLICGPTGELLALAELTLCSIGMIRVDAVKYSDDHLTMGTHPRRMARSRRPRVSFTIKAHDVLPVLRRDEE